MRFKQIFPYLIITILLIIMMKTCRSYYHLKDSKEKQISALSSDVKMYKNKNDENVALVKVLTLDNKSLSDELQSKDSVFLLLQAELKRLKRKLKEGDKVIYISSTTDIDKPADTVYVSIDNFGNPIYTDSLQTRYGKWITGTITLGKDTSKYDISILNEYIGSLYWKRDPGIKNFFTQKKYPVFELTNKNPYTYTTDLRVVEINSKPPPRFGIMLGPGLSLLPDLKIRPSISLIFGYKVL